MRFEEGYNTVIFQQELMEVQQEFFEEHIRLMEMEYTSMEIMEKQEAVKMNLTQEEKQNIKAMTAEELNTALVAVTNAFMQSNFKRKSSGVYRKALLTEMKLRGLQ